MPEITEIWSTDPRSSIEDSNQTVGSESTADRTASTSPRRTFQTLPEKVRVRIGTPSGTRPSPRPLAVLFYDPHAISTDGDGTELNPWPGLSMAIDEIEKRFGGATASSSSSDWVELRLHSIFSSTSRFRAKRKWEAMAHGIFMAMAYMLAIPLVAILLFLLIRAWPALSWSFLTQNPQERMTAGGIWAPLVGTFCLLFGSLLLAAPIGIMAGIYLNEYAKNNWFHRLINLAVVNLAGVPSIVHALFGVGAFVLAARMGESLLAACCTLAIMTLPVIIASTREALDAVPMSFRDACWNMGATRWQTIRTVVLPNAISGILTGVILQVSRAAGETAPILFTGAAFFLPVADHGWGYYFPYGPQDRVMALSMHLFTLRTQVNLPEGKEYLEYGTAVVLIGLVIAVNSLSIGIRTYLRSTRRW
jgi:phosphate transport system permease protein